ncbi:zinc finger CCCH domain-containing protein 18-like isoform X2 [Leptopilina boulardi]|nr:zinc finger CCCH domain-containing protein 18-like isoform X2 [Leptopilina boulardi]
MSDSSSDNSSSEDYEESRRSVSPDTVASQSPRRSTHSDRKTPSTEASYNARSSASPLSNRGSKSPRTSKKSHNYHRSTSKSARSMSKSPASSGSSQKSRSPSPTKYSYKDGSESPQSNRSSRSRSNNPDSPPSRSNPCSPSRSNQGSPLRSNQRSPSRSNPGSPETRSNRSCSPQMRSNRSSSHRSNPSSNSRPGSNRSSPQPQSPNSPRPDSNRSFSRPRSNHSSPRSPNNCRFQRTGPMSPKSPRMTSSPASPNSPQNADDYNSPPNSPTMYRGHSPKSPLDRNSESRPSSPKSPRSPASPRTPLTPQSPRSPRSPASPRSQRSSVKSPDSGRNTPKSMKSSPSVDRHLNKRSSPHSPEGKSRNCYNEIDGEQISDGDMDDVSQSALKSKPTPISHGEDLSDVSDLDSMDDDGDREHGQKKTEEIVEQPISIVNNEKIEREEKIAPESLAEENEQLDFEADGQWKDEREDGETEPAPIKETKEINDKEPKDKDKDKVKAKEVDEENDKEDGEEEDDDDDEKGNSELEEGELSDGDDARPEETEPRPVCRFYNRGQCTWGVSCRFLHPGVTDKGNYTMFDMVRPMAYPPHAGGPHEFRPHIERPSLMRPLPGFSAAPPHVPKTDELVSESPWERGLRQAKEMMRKANKRKESDMDFEEKKMNLSLGQEELDREAGYYVRPASPEPPIERWPPREPPQRVSRAPAPRITPDHYADEPEGYYPPTPHEYYRRVQYKSEGRSGMENYRERYDYHSVQPRNAPHSNSPPPHPRERERDREREREREREYYEKYEKKHKRPSREVIVERIPSSKTWREEEPQPTERTRGDEWADPWMRRKSPGSVRRNRTSSKRSRRQSYSSGSSYSSSSSSRSTSHSSYTSYDSQSRSRSPSPPSRSRVNAKTKTLTAAPPPAVVAPPVRGAMLMNPPAPSPRGSKGSTSPTGTLHRRAGLNPPAPSPLTTHPRQNDKTRDKAALAAAAVAKVIKGHSRSRSSHSSSGSDSSGSSSDSSESSYSSSSSESRRKKGSTPPIRKDTKALDALKVSGNKQQIKLTLKPSQSATAVKKVDRSASIAGKKRPAETSPTVDSKASVAAAAAKAAKKASSRREELLKQLKAVEDAIARKRSKV